MAGNEKFTELASNLVGSTYAKQGLEASSVRQGKLATLLQQGKLPDKGWSDQDIEQTLLELSSMDSNNFPSNCGVGEREARIYSGIVRRRHFGLGHGIGRSGDICEVQPKAAGSSIINKLTNSMLLDTLKLGGVSRVKQCFLVPTATGMALTLCMLYFRKKRPKARYVLWSRIDQKSCFKSILTAGCTPVILQLKRLDDELQTDLHALKLKVDELGAENIICIFSTTSCFAPRAHDDLPEIGKICKENNIPHLVNNAYGVQSSKCCFLIDEAARVGRLDLFVQSTDKNYLVPVGGAIIAGFDRKIIAEVGQTYPGRGSGTPSLDIFITLLGLGAAGFKTLLATRKNNFLLLQERMERIAERFGLHLLKTKNNTISIALTVGSEGKAATHLGSMLFTRGVSGTRVVTMTSKDIEGYRFE
ncbi:O-phosphoseryl-tRNA(Sec) selenium transferase isoform X2 [Eurytemora carolleeae]|nr:O-phosphoseryl-tRNA(Sec) selenium transferase isoform X2 [Eurytemora carolleeae]|eukprot:XP_023342194.1 O-phosphoseryl-tRNA(Sec) selenium transferase-like isoform X2 [Eurytemora affinis]